MITSFRHLLTVGVIALAFDGSIARAQSNDSSVPPVPSSLEVPAGHSVYLKGEASGTQNYVCLPTATGVAWTFFAPEATLFINFRFFGNEVKQQITTHFLSPNPDEGGRGRATWQSSFDSSAVWAAAIQNSSDPAFVAQGAIPWLLLQQMGKRRGPNGGELLSNTSYIQRLNTGGGLAPSTGCSEAGHVGATALVPYTADYFFYKKTGNKD